MVQRLVYFEADFIYTMKNSDPRWIIFPSYIHHLGVKTTFKEIGLKSVRNLKITGKNGNVENNCKTRMKVTKCEFKKGNNLSMKKNANTINVVNSKQRQQTVTQPS